MTMLTLSALAVTFATVIPVGEFRSIALTHGGHVIVRHGAVQRVSTDGDPRCTRVHVDNGQRLLIDTSRGECPRGHRTQIEVVTPTLPAVSVSNGGTVQAVGAFPAQASIHVNVEQGGTIDIRSIVADRVDASVYSGGRIFTNPRKRLYATVESGGVITYWGDVEDLRRSVRQGGVVTRGEPEDAEKPLPALGPDLPPLPPLAPLPPLPPLPPVPPLPHH